MRRLALVNSESLLGQELKESLGRRPDLCSDLRLLTTSPDETGKITRGLDGAAIVQAVDGDGMLGVDLVIVCPGPDSPSALGLSDETRVIWVDPAEPPQGAVPIVAGVNLERLAEADLVMSPRPTVIAVATLLAPLTTLRITEAVCWALEPTSSSSQEGIDELLEQTRSILSFSPELPTEIFGRQLAFNLLPSPTGGQASSLQAAEVLGLEVAPQVQIIRSGAFHGLALGVFVRFEDEVSTETIRELLLASSAIEASDHPESLGPIDAAAQESMLLGQVEAAAASANRAYWLWAVMDNLVLGGARNVERILEALYDPQR